MFGWVFWGLLVILGLVGGALWLAWCHISLFALLSHEFTHKTCARALGIEYTDLGWNTSGTAYQLRLDERTPLQSLVICCAPVALSIPSGLLLSSAVRYFSWSLSGFLLSLALLVFGYELSLHSLPSHADCRCVTDSLSYSNPISSIIALALVSPFLIASLPARWGRSYIFFAVRLCWMGLVFLLFYRVVS